MQSLISFLGSDGFVPHGYCLTWRSALLWLHVLSDSLIVLAYYSIPITLMYFVRNRKDFPYPGLFIVFGLFIVACGTTHLLSVITIWIPLYWLDGVVKAATATISVCAAFMTYWAVPRALQLRSPTQLEAEVANKSRELIATIAELRETQAALVVSEQRLKLAVASGQVGIWDYHLRTNELIWDDTMFALYGARREDFSGAYDAWSSRLHPEDKQVTEAALQAAIDGIKDYAPEFRVIWPDGKIRYIKGYATVIRDDDGNPLRMIGTNWDNYEHATTLHQLQLAHAAINHSKSSYFWFNRLGEVVDVNDHACRSLGYGRTEMIGLHPWDFDPDYSADSWQKDWLEKQEKGVCTFESRHRRKDGTVFPVEISTNYLVIGNEEYGFCHTLDISERKKAEQDLQESKNQLNTLIRTIPDLIWLKNTEGVYLFCNSRFEDVSGTADSGIVGKSDYDFFAEELASAFQANDRIAMAKGGTSVKEEWITFADGHKELLEVTKTPLLDGDGNILGVIGIG
ncbi:MAG: PAS domain S-box protein, partial [Methylococcaceae bacterium]|nr:PAS domain S-box protein [Methylococcaceae bacterium]